MHVTWIEPLSYIWTIQRNAAEHGCVSIFAWRCCSERLHTVLHCYSYSLNPRGARMRAERSPLWLPFDHHRGMKKQTTGVWAALEYWPTTHDRLGRPHADRESRWETAPGRPRSGASGVEEMNWKTHEQRWRMAKLVKIKPTCGLPFQKKQKTTTNKTEAVIQGTGTRAHSWSRALSLAGRVGPYSFATRVQGALSRSRFRIVLELQGPFYCLP